MESLSSLLFCSSVALLCLTSVVGGENDCKFPNHSLDDQRWQRAYNMLSGLRGHKYSFTDPGGNYNYVIGICTSAASDGNPEQQDVGAIQIDLKHDRKSVNIGRYTKSNIFAGTNWVYLEYREGDTYGHHCGRESRRAAIMIVCDPSASDSGSMIIVEEQKNKTAECYYLFEMNSRQVCLSKDLSTLSIGSILVIVFFAVLAMYLLFGFLYQRFVLGAKGLEQIPNYSFWQDFGNLQSDGCSFVCRSGRHREHSYKGVGDDQLEEVEERDDNLLPM